MECLKGQFHAGRLLNGRYETVSPLNHGSFGMVVMAKDHTTGKDVAIKCLTKPSLAADNDSGFKVDDRSEELQIHSLIGAHPNIVNLLDSFESETHTYIVLEYCSMGDLYEAIRQDKGPKETEHVRSFMLQLLDAIEFLHRRGIFHRDIKPENIFLTANGSMKLGDFGLATTDVWSYETAVGSDRYMAPEQYDHAGSGLSPLRADVWSIGICLLNILFSRNPFGVPAASDPLFQDYSRDRQNLFDVFPNMSQDTFQVLTHCLALDPAKRDLALVREALERVVSFTTDDESLDEFCTENRDVVTATANRQPLRTPSVTSPSMAAADTYPWTRALQMVSPNRKLSVVPDTETISEDLFASSDASSHDWFDKADTQSFESTADSGLGLSIGSSIYKPETGVTRSRPIAIAGSLPSRASSKIASFFGKKKAFESKSWSDLYEEDEEEEELVQQLARSEIEKKKPVLASRPSILSRRSKISMLSQEDESDDGRSTPRGPVAQSKDTPVFFDNFSQESLPAKDENISEHTGFIFEEHNTPTPRYSPPTKRGLIDKWTALGEMRRRGGNGPVQTAAPKNVPQSPESIRDRFRPTTLRSRFTRTPNRAVDHSVWQQKDWNTSRDWRRSDNHLPRSPLSMGMHPGSQLDGFGDLIDEYNDPLHNDPLFA